MELPSPLPRGARWAVAAVFGAVALWVLGVSTASAHGLEGPPHAQNALFDGQHLVAVPTNFGLVSADGDGWSWTPEELVPGVVRTSAMVDGQVALGTTDGLQLSDDGGCTWQSPAELVGMTVLTIKADADTVWAGTEATTRPSGLFVSHDAGLSWEPTELHAPDIRVSGIEASGTVRWAAGFEADIGAWRLWLDGGDGFAAIDLGEPDRTRLFTMRADDAVLALLRGDSWEVMKISPDGTRESWPVAHEVVDADFREGRLLYVSSDAGLYDVESGRLLRSEVYCVIEDGHCLSTLDEAAADLIGGVGLRWADVQPRQCESENQGLIDELWLVASAAGFGPQPETSTPESPETNGESGCCAHVQRTSQPWWLLFAVLLMRRRTAAKMGAIDRGAKR